MVSTLVVLQVLADHRHPGSTSPCRPELLSTPTSDPVGDAFMARTLELLNVLLAVKEKAKNSGEIGEVKKRLGLDEEERTCGGCENVLSVWLSWTAAPPTSGLLGFSRRGDWLPLYGPPLPRWQQQPGPSSLCSSETSRKCEPVSAARHVFQELWMAEPHEHM